MREKENKRKSSGKSVHFFLKRKHQKMKNRSEKEENWVKGKGIKSTPFF